MITAPFSIIYDTREQLPFTFQNVCIDRKKAFVLTQRATLHTGDYSIAGYEDKVCVERKSLQDLYQTLGKGRERFIRELERMQDCERSLIVVESPYTQILQPCDKDPLFYSRMYPEAVYASIVSFSKKYQKTFWKATHNRRHAELETFRFLLKFWQHTTNPPTDSHDTEENDSPECTNDTREQTASLGGSGYPGGV